MSRTPKSRVLDARQAAALVGERVETLRRMARQGEIPSRKQGRAWRLAGDDLLRWSAQAPRRTPPRPAKPLGGGATPLAPGVAPARLPGKARAVPPIVGIGASAGGLEALDLFLRNVPEKCGLSVVVVQHLDPTRKGMQTLREELTSTNEELQSTNEELQSTNEEPTTSKEELPSMNEALQTLNHELEAKLEDLKRAGDDMKNLLYSTDIATLFLDDALTVRRFTTQMATLVKLIPRDIGRPITDLASVLVFSELVTDARSALRSLARKETPVETDDGRRFSARIMPHRTTDDRVDGVVITFVAIAGREPREATRRRELPGLRGSR